MSDHERTLVPIPVAGGLAVASSFAAVGPTPAYVVAPVGDLVVALTPDQVVTLSILWLGSLGSLLGFGLAHVIAIGLFGGIAAGAAWAGDRFAAGPRAEGVAVLGGGAAGLLLGLVLGGSLLSGGAAGLGLAVGQWATRHLVAVPTAVPSQQRRRVLGALAAVAGFGGLAFWSGREAGGTNSRIAESVFGTETEPGLVDREPVKDQLASARADSFDVEGLSGLVSDIEHFYEVDINSIDPRVDADSWSVQVTGAVDRPMEFRYRDLLSFDIEHRFVTLRCVGDSLNGHQLDTALWTGVPVSALLDAAGPRGEYVMLRAADRYFEEFPVSALEDGFLAFGMNGEVLPRGHGYPVRALIPGHWGEINVKWLTEIEILDQEMKGYWEQRGWHGTGPVNTVAKLWAESRQPDGRIVLAGPAYAGTRGIDRVEVSADGGENWTDAELGPELPGTDVWRQWRHVLDPIQEPVDVVVRATDGTGSVQPEEDAQPYPSGATGWVRKRIDPA